MMMLRYIWVLAMVVVAGGCATDYSKREFDEDATNTVGYAANAVTEQLPDANSAEVCKGNPNYIQVPWGSWLTSDGDECILKAHWDWTFHTHGAGDPYCPDAGIDGCRGGGTPDAAPDAADSGPAASPGAPEGGESEGGESEGGGEQGGTAGPTGDSGGATGTGGGMGGGMGGSKD